MTTEVEPAYDAGVEVRVGDTKVGDIVLDGGTPLSGPLRWATVHEVHHGWQPGFTRVRLSPAFDEDDGWRLLPSEFFVRGLTDE